MSVRITWVTTIAVAFSFVTWGQTAPPPPVAKRVHAILDEARTQPVEVFADITFKLLDRLSVEDKKAALEEVFQRAGSAREPLMRRYAIPVTASPVPGAFTAALDLALVRDMAHDLRLDALSLRCRAVQELLKIDPKAARALMEQISRVAIPKTDCTEEFVPDAGILVETLAAVAEHGVFTKEEEEKQARWFLVERAAGLAGTSWEIAAAAKALPRLAHTEKQAQILSAALAADLGLTDSDRAYTSAVVSGSLVENVLGANRILCAAGAPEILPAALRAYLVRHLKGVRCKDDFLDPGSVEGAKTSDGSKARAASTASMDPVTAFNKSLGDRRDLTPIAGEETQPASVDGEAARSKYENAVEFRDLWSQIDALRASFGRDVTAARLTSDASYRFRQTLSRIQGLEAATGQDPISVFHQKCALLLYLLDMAPAGETHRLAMGETVGVLGDSTVLEKSPAEWLVEVNSLVGYFGIFSPEVVRAAGAVVPGLSLTTGLEFWQGLADSRLPALSLYGRIGMIKAEAPALSGRE